MRLRLKIAKNFIFKNVIEHLAVLVTIVIGLAVQLFIISLAFSLSLFIDDMQTAGNRHFRVIRNISSTDSYQVFNKTKEEMFEETNGMVKIFILLHIVV